MRGLHYVENDEGIAGKTFMSGPENAPLKERASAKKATERTRDKTREGRKGKGERTSRIRIWFFASRMTN